MKIWFFIQGCNICFAIPEKITFINQTSFSLSKIFSQKIIFIASNKKIEEIH